MQIIYLSTGLVSKGCLDGSIWPIIYFICRQNASGGNAIWIFLNIYPGTRSVTGVLTATVN